MNDVQIGTPKSETATRLLLLGAGELGREVVIEAQRLGVECIAVDRYADAPAMQVAHRSHVSALLVSGDRQAPVYGGLSTALAEPDTQIRLFGKPEVIGHRRMGVAIALGADIPSARDRARRVAQAITVK